MLLSTISSALLYCIFQYEHGSESAQQRIDRLMPKKVKRRRKVQTEDGVRKSLFSFKNIKIADVLTVLDNYICSVKMCWV